MDELISYSKYDYLICFPHTALLGHFLLYGTSNRVLQSEWLISMGDQPITKDDEDGMTLGDIFPKYLQIKLNQSREISKEETLILASIRNFYATLKEQISSDHRISLKNAQIMFTLPMDYAKDEYEEILREFFLEVGWITNEDDKNKLLLVPFIDAFVHFLQNPPRHERKMQFERERKYLLLSRIVPEEDSEMECYTATCFQMQCARELASVSRKLASSDFLLTPTIIDQKTISLPRLDILVLSAIKSALVPFIEGTTNGDINQDMEFSKMAGTIADKLAWSRSFQNRQTIGEFVEGRHSKWKHQYLGDLRMDHFVRDVFNDTSIQHYTKQVCDFVQRNLHGYGCIMDSPDGVRGIILHDYGSKGSYNFLIEEALFQANVVKRGSEFKETPLDKYISTSGAFKPMKMIQVANAILPPIIIDAKIEPDDDIALDVQEDNSNLIPMNSFYIQASINKGQIEFILNKVFRAQNSGNWLKLFTVQKQTVVMDEVVDTVCDSLWNHFQMLESQGQLATLARYCQDHYDTTLSMKNYKCFSANMKVLIQDWFQSKCTLTNDDLDKYHFVPSSENCTCALYITQRMLLELGLKPAVTSIAATITSITFSSDNFGLYQITAMIVNTNVEQHISNTYYSQFFALFLEENLRNCLQFQQRKPHLFCNQKANRTLSQYIGTGDYVPVSTTTYTLAFRIRTRRKGEHSDSSQKNEWLFRCEHTILTKGDELPLQGITRTFSIIGSEHAVGIKCYASQDDRKRILAGHVAFCFYPEGPSTHITVNISPEHHSSALNFAYSCIVHDFFEQNGPTSDERKDKFFNLKTSDSISERLSLRKQCS